MRYNKPDILITPEGKQYYKAKKYPPIPPTESDIYVVTVQGDRYDLLANTYYQDASLWWIIPMANGNTTFGSMFPEPGAQLRIPTDLNLIMSLFDELNINE
jgi:hypothetical protein